MRKTCTQKGLGIPVALAPLRRLDIPIVPAFPELVISLYSFVLLIQKLLSFFHFILFHLKLLLKLYLQIRFEVLLELGAGD